MSFASLFPMKGERSPYSFALVKLLAVVSLLLLGGGWVTLHAPRGALHWGTDLVGLGRNEAPECRPASVTVSVATSIINAFAQVVILPAVQSETNAAIIPEQEDGHVWVDEILLHHFQMKTLSVRTATPNSGSLTADVKGFGLEVNETRFRYTYLGIRCYGHFTATLNETDIEAVLGFTLLPESRWNATFSELKFTWGTLAIQHALDSKACGMAQSLVELFTGQLDKYIADKVQKKLDEDGKNKAAETLNSRFADFNLRALTPPLMTSERLTVVLDGTPTPLGCPPQPPVTTVPQLLPRDMAAHATVHDINNILYNAATNGFFAWEDHLPDSMNTSLFSDVLPEVYAMCPECPMYVVVKTATPPVTAFLPSHTVTLTIRDIVVGLMVEPRTLEEWRAFRHFMSRQASLNPKFKSVYRRLGFSADASKPNLREFPVLALSCGATFGVQRLSFDDGRALSYEVLGVQDFTVEVAASIIGDVNADEIEEKGTKAWNEIAVPLINARSPYKLPFFLRKALLNMTSLNADVGVNIGFMEEFTSAFSHLAVS